MRSAKRERLGQSLQYNNYSPLETKKLSFANVAPWRLETKHLSDLRTETPRIIIIYECLDLTWKYICIIYNYIIQCLFVCLFVRDTNREERIYGGNEGCIRGKKI